MSITKMALKEEENLMANAHLLKIIGLYQFLNPHGPRVFGYNVFKFTAVVFSIIITMMFIVAVLNTCYCWDNINELTKYAMFMTSCSIGFIKIYCLFRNADQIWNCVQLTSIDYLSYKYHRTEILCTGQAKIKFHLTLVKLLWASIVVTWMTAPFLVHNYFMQVKIDDTIRQYRFNTLNWIYPVSDTFYNQHFLAYYYIESATLTIWCHSSMVFDVLVTSMCMTISYQLKTIANSFQLFNVAHEHLTSSATETAKHNLESEFIFDFKVLIQDQQKVVENMNNIYRVLRPFIIIQLASDSTVIIFLSCLLIMNYFSAEPLSLIMIARLLFSMTSYISHLFFVCYLFEDNSEQIESLNFGLYSSGWTENSLYFKQLILYSMRMNNSQNIKLKLSQQKIVNFELFKSIMETVYSISSLLVNQKFKKR